MIFRLFVPLTLVFVFFLYLAYLNPGSVTFVYAPGRFINVPAVILVMLSFLAGAIALTALGLLKSFGVYLLGLRGRFRRFKVKRLEKRISNARENARRGKQSKALKNLKKALSSDPKNFDALMLKGNLLRETGDNKKALESHSLALAHRPSDVSATLQLKEDYLAAGQLDSAYRLLEQARGSRPKDVAILTDMRDIKEKLNDFKSAIVLQKEILKKLVSGAPEQEAQTQKMAQLYCLRAEHLIGGKKLQEAKRELEKACKVMPGFLPASMMLGDIAVEQGNIRKAEAVMQKEFRLTRSLLPLRKLEQSYRLSGMEQKIEQMYRQARTIAPENNMLILFIAMAQIEKLDFSGALRTLQDADYELKQLAVYNLMAGVAESSVSDSGAPSGDYFQKAMEREWSSFMRCRCSACRFHKVGYFHVCPECGNWNSAEPLF